MRVAAATSAAAPGSRSAAATACCAMPTWHTTLVRPTRLMSFMMGAGPATQPTRQPIMRSSFEAEPTVTVRSARPGCVAGCTGRRSPKTIRSMAASQMIQAP